MNKIWLSIRKLALIGSIVFLTSCGGGGGGSNSVPTDPNTIFQLFPPGFFSVGFSETTNFTGTDTGGGVFTATASVQTQAQTTFLGQPAIPQLVQIQLTNTATGAFISDTGTGFWSTSATDRRNLGFSNSSSTTVSATTTAIPQTAKIGDFGDVGTYTDNAGDVSVDSWRLDDGFNGRAKLVVLSTETDQFGTLITSSTTTDLIDTSGNVISEEIKIFFADVGITLTLNSL